jgi:DNA-binding MarR family transcriptional regulator
LERYEAREGEWHFRVDNSRNNDYSLDMNSGNPASSPGVALEDRIFVALLKAADALSQEAEQLIKSAGLTMAQYNVLRILRGAEPEGLLCRGISERMISHDPDITRLLDRMENHGWITRQREKEDRRVVKTRITEDGLAALKKLDQPVRDLHKGQFRHMSASQLKTLAKLLAEVEKRELAQRADASKDNFRS